MSNLEPLSQTSLYREGFEPYPLGSRGNRLMRMSVCLMHRFVMLRRQRQIN